MPKAEIGQAVELLDLMRDGAAREQASRRRAGLPLRSPPFPEQSAMERRRVGGITSTPLRLG